MTQANSRFWVLAVALACGAAEAVAQTQPTTAPATITALGSVEAFWSSDQYARAAGYVAEVKADIGDRVKKGQVLAVIDAPELERDLAVAEATLAARKELMGAAEATRRQSESALEVARKQAAGVAAEAKLAEATLGRQVKLFETKAATDQQLDEARAKAAVANAGDAVAAARIAAAEADLARARADVAVARAQVDVAAAQAEKGRTLLSFTRIVAPFDAVVTRRAATPGDLVQAPGAGGGPLFTCQQTDTVRVVCDVPESGAAGVGNGAAAEVVVTGRKAFRGTVTRVSGAMNAATRTMRVEIDLPNAGGSLRPGMYAQVTFAPTTAAAPATR